MNDRPKTYASVSGNKASGCYMVFMPDADFYRTLRFGNKVRPSMFIHVDIDKDYTPIAVELIDNEPKELPDPLPNLSKAESDSLAQRVYGLAYALAYHRRQVDTLYEEYLKDKGDSIIRDILQETGVLQDATQEAADMMLRLESFRVARVKRDAESCATH